MFAELERLDATQLATRRESSFPSIWESAFHIVAAEWIWLKRWQGQSPRASVASPNASAAVWDGLMPSDAPRSEELRELAVLHKFSDDIEHQRQDFLCRLTDEALQCNLQFSDMAGAAYSEPLVQVMQHLVNHGSYHRGQVTTLLRQAGGQPVALDMIVFFREQKPNTTTG